MKLISKGETNVKIRVGTRGSRLALTQTESVIDTMKAHHTLLEAEIVIIKTKGDQIQDVALDKIGDKGLFVTEIEKALLEGHIDMAVHSLKDMPGDLTKGLVFAPEIFREDPRDVLVMNTKISDLNDIPNGAVIGTGSKRRKYQLLSLRPDLEIRDIRGNVDTRLEKMRRGDYDGIILAQAGLNRLGIKPEYSYVFSEMEMLPAPAQGILAIQIRENDQTLLHVLRPMRCENTCLEALAERAFLKGIQGSCHKPIGAKATIDHENLSLTGLYGDEEGDKIIIRTKTGHIDEAENIGFTLAQEIVEAMTHAR